MRNEQLQFLNLRSLPARLHVEEVAWYLGFSPHDIPILVSKGLLKPLGNPAPNGGKYFAASALKELREDVHWLSRASNAILIHWRSKNARRLKGAKTEPASAQLEAEPGASDA